jgi:hypothetical protein
MVEEDLFKLGRKHIIPEYDCMEEMWQSDMAVP